MRLDRLSLHSLRFLVRVLPAYAPRSSTRYARGTERDTEEARRERKERVTCGLFLLRLGFGRSFSTFIHFPHLTARNEGNEGRMSVENETESVA